MTHLAEHEEQSLPTSGEVCVVGDGGAGGAGARAVATRRRSDEAGAEFAPIARAVFADRRPAPDNPSYWATISGKASRLLARSIATKTMRKVDPQPLVSFTFDDAAASSCREGAAILEQHGVRGTYYICAGGCGASSPSGPLASANDIEAVSARGHEVGCHTYSHLPVSTLGRRELARDIERNRVALMGICAGVVPRNFAFPYGDVSFSAKRYLGHRFDSCRSIRFGLNVGTIDLGALRSWPLENAAINRARIMKLIDETVRRHGWLIFNSHGVERTPGRFGITPDLFDFAVAAARSGGCRAVTIAEGLSIARG
jgi:peptidoglycan/xylan/chitin deacetylase (PgdA/CDA1 family)